MMNNIFDLLNSRSSKGKGYNNPLRFSNQHHWRIYFEEVKEYLLGLTNLETGRHLVQNDPKRTGFLGIYCNIIAFTRIFNVKLRTILGPIMFYRKCMICNSEVPGPILSQIVNVQLNSLL